MVKITLHVNKCSDCIVVTEQKRKISNESENHYIIKVHCKKESECTSNGLSDGEEQTITINCPNNYTKK